MTAEPVRHSAADRSAQQRPTPNITTANSADVERRLARRLDEAAARYELTAAVIERRLQDLPAAQAELTAQDARCQELRAAKRCPGRCVIRRLERPQL